ncbi:hypothetical protein GCM10022215_23930 [Nocardioides fonticola]|uniref:Secreted protein n=1 Tax=Nocardioides fonticola TaxID=450363 RepID=A0ABP7XKK8_9ACTN
MRMMTRLAIVTGLLLFGGALAATFLPTSPDGATCGTWVSPEYGDDDVEDLLGDLESSYRQANSLGESELAGRAAGLGASIVQAKQACDDALGTRRTTTIVLVVLAAALPVGLVFVGRGSDRSS